MRIWTVENGELVPYERTGECNLCAECCCNKTIGFCCQAHTEGKNSDAAEEAGWSEWEGWHALDSQGLWWWFKVWNLEGASGHCESLVDGKCAEWKTDEFRAICRYWPFHPSNLEKFPKCSFRFERIEE